MSDENADDLGKHPRPQTSPATADDPRHAGDGLNGAEQPNEHQIDHAAPAGGPVDHDVLPPLAVRGPDGRRVVVTALATRHTVGELADALGIRRRSAVHIDGRVVDRKVPLDRSGVVQGSDVTGKPGHSPCTSGRTTPRAGRPVPGHLDAPAMPSSPAATGRGLAVDGYVAVVESGPAAGTTVHLGPGRHLVGRAASAELRLADGHVELHHALIDVDASEPPAATLTQLTGRVPCRVATPPATTPDEPVLEPTALASGSVVQIGASRVRFDRRDAAGPSDTDASFAAAAAAPAALAPLRGDPWRMTLHRRPRQLAEWDPEPIDPPAVATANSARAAGGLIAVVLSMAGGVAMAVLLGHPMFLMFSALGLLGWVGTRISGKLSDRKHRRRSAAESKRDRERFASGVADQRAARLVHHLSTASTIAAARATACGLTAPLWMRRADHPDAFSVSLGRGTTTWSPRLASASSLSPEAEAIVTAAARLDDVPVTTDLGPERSLALVGAHADAVARSLILQLAAFTGPADWRLVVVADDASEWEWCTWLPHASSGADASAAGGPLIVAADDAQRLGAVLARLDDGDERHVVVVTDRPELLATRTGALRRYLGTAASAAVVAVVCDGAVVPSMCRSLLEIGSLCTARWCPDTSATTGSTTLHAAGLAGGDAEAAARRLAGVHDPEDPAEAAGALPAAIGMSRLFARCGLGAVDDPIAIAARWRPARHPNGAGIGDGDGHPRAALGVTSDGVVEIDLVRDGPHALIAGTTGAGKSELLRTFVGSLAARSSPDDLTFVLIDYKGGSTFDACADVPHTVGVVTDLDDRLAERALVSLEAEIRRRERLLRDAGVDNLDVYRSDHRRTPLPRLVVVIDEFAAMVKELPGFIPSLVGIAQRGRSLGIHLVLATQRPAGVVSDDIRANTNLRIALRLQDRADAMDIVGVADPASFPRGTPGRAMLRLGPGETLVFQTAHSSGTHQPMASGGLHVGHGGDVAEDSHPTERDRPSELGVLVRSVRGAASLCEIAPPFRPWLEQLPRAITPTNVAALGPGAVGLVDDPDSQAQYALRWDRSDGNLALVGSLGSGTTTALRTLLIDAVRTPMAGGDDDASLARPHVYVLDGRGDGRLEELTALPGCGAVVGVNESERRTRLVRFLSDELTRRKAATADGETARPIVLAVDGLGSLLAALGGPGEMDEHARLVRVLADGVCVGIHAVATLDRPAGVAMSVLASFGQRWLFHVDDPMDGVAMGVKAAHVPPAIPGRIVVTSTRLDAQVAVLPLPPADRSRHDDPANVGAGATPVPIGTLPDSVDATALPPGSSTDGATAMPIGLDFATLEPTALDVPDGEHVIVVGPARSGRSTALARLVAAWRQAHPEGVVIVSCPRRTSPLLGWAAHAVPGHVVADDAAAIVAAVEAEPVLIAIDDAERIDDPGGALLALVNEHRPGVTVVAAGRPDALRSLYGHWTAVVRRSRIGLVMSTSGDADGELLGEPLPRRSPIPARQGLAWAFDGAGRRLVQVAREPEGGMAALSGSLAPTARR